MSKVKFNCLSCEKESEVYMSQIRKGGGKYCSRKCALEQQYGSLENRIRDRLIVVESGCWEYQGHTKNGYGVIIHKGKTLKVHRAFYQIVNNVELTSEEVVMHSCDNRKCSNPEHLKSGTRRENTQDMVNKNRQAKGENNGQSKLSENDVNEIRNLYREGKHTQLDIAIMFGIRQSAVSKIVNFDRWGIGENV